MAFVLEECHDFVSHIPLNDDVLILDASAYATVLLECFS
jgi:hypothetical protein